MAQLRHRFEEVGHYYRPPGLPRHKQPWLAAAAGIPISTHLYPEVASHVMRVSETAHWLEWQDWANPVLQLTYEVKAGELHIPDVPGIGLEWDEKAVAAHLPENF